MRDRKLPVLAGLTLVFIWAFLFLGDWFKPPPKSVKKPQNINESVFFDEQSFYMGINQVKKEGLQPLYKITGAIIPHDYFQSLLVADFFNRLFWQKPKTLIIFGPDHDERGKTKITTSTHFWQTPFGLVEPSSQIIKDLLTGSGVSQDDKVLSSDHSAAGLMPFIKYYLPQVKVVPILLSARTTQDDTKALAKRLSRFLDDSTVIIAAVDFSHYLSAEKAQKKDEETLKVLMSFNYPRLFGFNNDYLDSPASVGVLLMALEEKGKTKMEVLHHTNSSDQQTNKDIPTTGYFSMVFY